MHNLLQHPGKRPLRPCSTWLRWLVVACVLLVCVMSTAQVCHSHFDLAPKHGSQQNGTNPEGRCQLCVAMHSALPATLHVAPEPMLQIQHLDSVATEVARIHRWSMAMANRPPPAARNRA